MVEQDGDLGAKDGPHELALGVDDREAVVRHLAQRLSYQKHVSCPRTQTHRQEENGVDLEHVANALGEEEAHGRLVHHVLGLEGVHVVRRLPVEDRRLEHAEKLIDWFWRMCEPRERQPRPDRHEEREERWWVAHRL